MSLIEPALFVYTALITDARTLRIPNWTWIAIVLAYLARAAAMPATVDPLLDASIGVGVFATGWILHALGWKFPFAPGDWKLLAAAALWLGPDNTLVCVLVMGVLGALMSAGVLLGRNNPWAFKAVITLMPALGRPGAQANVIPYGLAIGAGALVAMWLQAVQHGVI